MANMFRSLVCLILLAPSTGFTSQAQVVTLKQVAGGPIGNATLLQEKGVSSEAGVTIAIISKEDDWQRWHRKLNGGVIPVPALPVVNFKESFLLFAGLAAQVSGGHSLVPNLQAELFEGTLTVKMERRAPPAGQMAVALVTVPYFVVQVPRAGVKRVRLEWDDGKKSLEIRVKP